MPLVLYNSLTHRKEVFAPLDPERVRLYVCGPTVYDRAHIGNGRAVVVFDQLCRVLREVYGAERVTYVRNITDVEDKIIDAARANGESIAALTARTTADYHADMAALGALPPDIEPRATAYIPQMIALIGRLIATDHAYAAEGHVLFSIAAAADYGKLSRRSQDEMIAGARVEVAPYKRDPGDFVLWKPSSADQPGWDSPWGRGRPGWHIECSAMSEANLGETFDIHGGGLDLIFPHHENEIAQSEGAHCGRPLARVWMHNEMLTVDGVKMSKSLGNIRTVRELLSEWNGEVIRLALLSTHYRDPLDWTRQKLDQSVTSLDRFYAALALEKDTDLSGGSSEAVRYALEDDLNTPLAITKMHEIAVEINSAKDQKRREILRKDLRACGNLLGILHHDPQRWRHGRIIVVVEAHIPMEFSGSQSQEKQEQIEGMEEGIAERIAERTKARRERRFADADRIRAELAEKGILLEDKPDGTTRAIVPLQMKITAGRGTTRSSLSGPLSGKDSVEK